MPHTSQLLCRFMVEVEKRTCGVYVSVSARVGDEARSIMLLAVERVGDMDEARELMCDKLAMTPMQIKAEDTTSQQRKRWEKIFEKIRSDPFLHRTRALFHHALREGKETSLRAPLDTGPRETVSRPNARATTN